MKNLDWNKINNDRDFQRLTNDLFALEINHPSFLSSSPEIGADGGWDGRYDGDYMNLDEGLWSFQAKWTKHDLNNAYNFLRSELKKELEKAKKNKVRYLLFSTNANLRVGKNDHIGKLEELNKDQQYVDRLFIWPRANLESKIIKYPWLRHVYFGDCQSPVFVPLYVFTKSEPLLEGKLIKRENDLNKIKEFYSDKKNNILIIHAGGGYGKTHFITEASKTKLSINSDKQTWFCRPSIRDINEAINDELDHSKQYVLFLDDAERYLDEAKKLIAHSQSFSPGGIKLILSCRTSGKEIVKNLATSQRIDNYRELELSLIPEEGLIKILKYSSDNKNIKNPERIVKELNGNLYLIVTTGKLIKGGEIDPKKIKKHIKDNLNQETTNALIDYSELGKNGIEKLLRELSVIVPFSKDKNSKVLDKLSSLLNLKTDVLVGIIDKLLETKILRIVGSSIRFNPDMKGDIYLSVELDGNDGESLINNIFENWLSIYPEKITANLAAASRHSETDSASKAIKTLIKSWINDIDNTSDSQKSKRLELVTPISYLAPNEAVDLIYSYINKASTEGIYGLTRDNYGPVIYQILHIAGLEKSILDIILFIANKDLKGTYNNYEPASFIKQITSPIEVNIDSAINSLSEILKWVEKNNCSEIEAKLAVEAIRESLSGSHEHRESYSNKITFGRKILVYKEPFKEKVDKYRDKGMEILGKIVLHSNPRIQKIGIEIINDIGHEATSTDGDFWKRILSDKKQAISWLKGLVHNKTPFSLLSSIEDVLVRYWANNDIYPELSVEAADILREYPRSSEYIIFRYFVAHDVIIFDFTKIEKDAPSTSRWSWLVHNHFRLHDLKQEDLDKVVKQLGEKYKDKKNVVQYLNEFNQEVDNIRGWQYIPLIETWAKYNKDVIIEIVKNKKLLQDIPSIFHRGFYRVASDEDRNYIKNYAEKIISDLSNLNVEEVDNLLDLISRDNVPVDEFMPWLTKIIKNSNNHIKHIILHRAYFIFKDRKDEERKKVLDLLDTTIEGKVDSHALDMFEFLLHNALKWDLPEDELKKMRIKLFDMVKDISNIDYQIDELLNFVISGDLDKFINFIEYRLNKFHKHINQKDIGRFDPIPHNGFRFSESLIKDYKDFSKLMDKIHYWRSKDLLFTFDVDNLLRNFKKNENGGGDNYLKQYIEDKIKGNNKDSLKVAIDALYGIGFGSDTSDLFLKMLLNSEKVKILDEARGVFFHQVLSGGYSSSVGEAPPALVNKKNVLEAMHKKCPQGLIKNYIDSLIRSVGEDIQRHIDEGQELINPKN